MGLMAFVPCLRTLYLFYFIYFQFFFVTNSTSGINTEIKVNGQKLETITSFKYLGSVITDEDTKPEILFRIAQTTAAITGMN